MLNVGENKYEDITIAPSSELIVIWLVGRRYAAHLSSCCVVRQIPYVRLGRL